MLTVTVEGIYESDIGSGQKKYKNFSYTFDITRDREEGIMTHILRRFIPLEIARDKKKNGVPFSRIRNFNITDIKKSDKKATLLGKNILELNEWELQDLACLFDLYEAPLCGEYSLTELRSRTAEAYMKKVLKIPMKTASQKAQLDFYKQLPDGSFKLDFGEEKLLVAIPEGYFDQQAQNKKEKMKLSFFQQAGQAVANAVLTATGNTPVKTDDNKDDDFPNLDNIIE